jgi:hypothetical protein
MTVEYNIDAVTNFDAFAEGFDGFARPAETVDNPQISAVNDPVEQRNPTVGDVPERKTSGGLSNIQRTSIAERHHPLFS